MSMHGLYVIRRTDGAYVTRPGSQKSYTTKLELARLFTSREAAERELCPENERAVPFTDILRP